MGTGRLADLVRTVRVAALATNAPLTDGELLDAFLNRGDEVAFEALVRRHGPMVLGVCRRILGRSADAEDAFQAAFLVLVCKARSIVPRDLVGHWLYGVACRTALRARSQAMRRRKREKQVETLPEPARVEPDPGGDVQAILDEEVSALPEGFRAAVVLCDVGGLSQHEAARQLRVAEGTVASRLSRGRGLLRRRLARRGVTLAVGAAVSAGPALVAGVSRSLVNSTVQAASRGVVPPQVATLVEGVTKAMFLSKLKLVLVLPVVLAASVAALGQIASPPEGGKSDPVPGKPAGPAAAAPKATTDEPINHIWITQAAVQKELRLSEKQVKEVTDVRLGVVKTFEKDWKEAREQAKEGNYKRGRELQKAIQDAERKAFAEAAPRIVSEAAQTRLRQIQRQARGLHTLMRDPAVQKKLQLSDEQAKQIEGFLKEGLEAARKAATERAAGRQFLAPQTIEDAIVSERAAYAGAMKKALAVLTGPQRRAWDEYVGELFAFAADAPK